MNRTLSVNKVPGKLEGRDVIFDTWKQTQELIPLDSMWPEGDPAWRYLDKAGHMHRPELRQGLNGPRVKGYPTLFEVRSRVEWCDMCDEYHDNFEHYVCNQCGEKIKPRTRSHQTEYLEGPRNIEVVFIGNDESIELTQGPRDRVFHAEVNGKRFEMGRATTTMTFESGLFTVRIEFYVTKEV